jgi:hypothetical protein
MSDGTVLLGTKSAFADKKQNIKNCVSAGFSAVKHGMRTEECFRAKNVQNYGW